LRANSYGDAVINLNKEVAKTMTHFELLKKHDEIIMLEEQHFEQISEKCKVEILRQDQEKRIKHFDNDSSLALLEWQKERDLDQWNVYKSCLSTGNYKKVINIVETRLALDGIFWQRKSLVFKNLCMDVLKKLVQAYEMIANRHENNWQESSYTLVEVSKTIPKNIMPVVIPQPDDHVEPSRSIVPVNLMAHEPVIIPPQPRTLTFGELLEQFNTSPEIVQRSKEILKKYKAYQTVLLNIIGAGYEVKYINRKYFRQLLEIVRKIPKNLGKYNEFKNLPIKEVIEKTNTNMTYEPLSATSINDYLEHLQALLRWAKRDGHAAIDDFSDIRAKRESKAKYDKMPFTMEQIKTIMCSPEVQESKKYKTKGELYWCLVLGFLTGMRLGEICQLRLKDIRKQGDIDYISVNLESGKSVKTEQSVRDIPINDLLKKAGFLEYINAIRKTNKEDSSIFPYYNKGTNRPGDPISKRFTRILWRLKMKNIKLTFHSTRHNYRDFIRESDLNQVEYNLALELCGWSVEGGSIHNIYGSSHSLKRKLDVVNKIKYDGIRELI